VENRSDEERNRQEGGQEGGEEGRQEGRKEREIDPGCVLKRARRTGFKDANGSGPPGPLLRLGQCLQGFERILLFEEGDAEGFAHAEEERFELEAKVLGGGFVGGFESGGEVIGLTGAEQETAHGFERAGAETEGEGGGFEIGKRHVGGDVAQARIGEHIFEGAVVVIAHESAAGGAEKLAGGVAVVDGEKGSAMQRGGHLSECGFEADGEFEPVLVVVRSEVGAQGFEVGEPLRRGLGSFDELEGIAIAGDEHEMGFGAAQADGVDGEGVEEFIREDDAGERGGQSGVGGAAGVEGEVRKLRERFAHFAAAGAPFDDGEVVRGFECGAELGEGGGDEAAEDGLELGGGVEVALTAEGIALRVRVIAAAGVVEG